MTSRLPRRALALVTIAVLLVLAAVVVTVVRGFSADDGEPTAGQKPTAWEVLVQRRYIDGPSRQLALDAFASIFGPIPGGRAVDADEIGTRSGTPVMRWIGPYWEQLSPEQQSVVRSYVVGTPESSAGPAGQSGPHVLRAPPDPLTPRIRRLVDRVAREFQERYPAVEFVEPGKRLEVRAWNTLHPKGHVVTGPLVYKGNSRRPEIASTSDRTYAGCLITFHRPFLEAYRASPSPDTDTALVALVAHELFHCHQLRLLGIPGYWGIRDWISEGSAQWAGMKYAFEGVPNVRDTTFWPSYFAPYTFDPPSRRQSLFARAEANVGFFAQLDTSLGSPDGPWRTIDLMLASADDKIAFGRAVIEVGATGRNFLADWARGFVGDAALGREWRTTGPGLGDYQPQPPGRLPLGTKTKTLAGWPAVDKRVVALREDVEAVRITVKGQGGLAWRGDAQTAKDVIDARQEQTWWYCLQPEKCSCQSTDRAGSRHITAALTGGVEEAHFLAEAKTGAELCAQVGGGLPGTYAGPQPNTDIHLRFEKAGDDEYTLTMTIEGSHGSTAQGCQQDYGPTVDPAQARLRPQKGRFEGIATSVYKHGKRCFFQTHAVTVTVVDKDTVKLCGAPSPTCSLARRIEPDPGPVG
ncbi:hypothetical protein [Streptomyces sp. NBC_01443]|uniref:hypothetical protein n=1 Tax=Streptomyces sp. NBC_01443 TaxID=2903868 RepID=UPI00225B19F4|nr:hypothetical protein [Streptomyces sp. NBC_01443]MCX4633387.1 hypothetical protein [Streptomyces sp. NBC_01443]